MLNLTDLKDALRRATPGRWTALRVDDDWWVWRDPQPGYFAGVLTNAFTSSAFARDSIGQAWITDGEHPEQEQADAEYIGALGPQQMSEIIERLERAEAQVAAVRALGDPEGRLRVALRASAHAPITLAPSVTSGLDGLSIVLGPAGSGKSSMLEWPAMSNRDGQTFAVAPGDDVLAQAAAVLDGAYAGDLIVLGPMDRLGSLIPAIIRGIERGLRVVVSARIRDEAEPLFVHAARFILPGSEPTRVIEPNGEAFTSEEFVAI